MAAGVSGACANGEKLRALPLATPGAQERATFLNAEPIPGNEQDSSSSAEVEHDEQKANADGPADQRSHVAHDR
jgi:hypothetical protein